MNILSELLSSKIRAEIFRLLFGTHTDSLHMREIERRSGFSTGTVQSELKKLYRLDLIKKNRDGNRLYYQANREHPLYPEIRSIVLKTIGLVDRMRKALQQSSGIEVAFVFGSIARHDEKTQSDVDLIVIGNLGLRKLVSLLSGLSEEIGREINPHVFTPREFVSRKAKGEHFISRVLQEQKIFIIGNENDLAAMG
ncbi:MAG: nucleotidyltransferase domain-containing protein [Deltaproteobacteria bacterium]|nr:nucleotidyltransferase domain-containing protein [Deltaproteobacteria bacterium]